MYQYIVVTCVNLSLNLFRSKIFAKVKYFTCKIFVGKYFHFIVFGSVYENVVLNIFQCLAQRKMEIKKKPVKI